MMRVEEYPGAAGDPDPSLFEVLPQSDQVPEPFELAGVYAREPPSVAQCCPDEEQTPETTPVRSVSAAFTPDGTLSQPPRTLFCRLLLFEDSPAVSDDIDAYHDAKLRQECGGEEPSTGSDWVETSFTREMNCGHWRTAYSRREPLLEEPVHLRSEVSRPVVVFAFVLQSTEWGLIEVGTSQSPNPELGYPLETVERAANQCQDVAARHPRPTVEHDWPWFTPIELSRTEILSEMKAVIDQKSGGRGAATDSLCDHFAEEYDLTEPVVRKAVNELRECGEIYEPVSGHYRVA